MHKVKRRTAVCTRVIHLTTIAIVEPFDAFYSLNSRIGKSRLRKYFPESLVTIQSSSFQRTLNVSSYTSWRKFFSNSGTGAREMPLISFDPQQTSLRDDGTSCHEFFEFLRSVLAIRKTNLNDVRYILYLKIII